MKKKNVAGFKKIGEILPALEKQWGLTGAAQNRIARLNRLVKEIIGPELAPKVTVTRFKNGCATIEVEHHAIQQELSSFYKEGLLEDIRTLQDKVFVKDIKFCVRK